MADNLNVVRNDKYFSSDDEGDDKPMKARRMVQAYRREVFDSGEGNTLTIDDFYVVIFTYVLGNWKALVSTTVPDGRYYEVTYNHQAAETYIDMYVKEDHVCIPNPDISVPDIG